MAQAIGARVAGAHVTGAAAGMRGVPVAAWVVAAALAVAALWSGYFAVSAGTDYPEPAAIVAGG